MGLAGVGPLEIDVGKIEDSHKKALPGDMERVIKKIGRLTVKFNAKPTSEKGEGSCA
jgi:hypothetical protein